MKIFGEYEDKRLGPEYLELLTDLKTVINYGKYSSQVISNSPDWEGKEGETLFRYQVNGTGWFYYNYFWVNSGWSFLRWTSSANALIVDDNTITTAMIQDGAVTTDKIQTGNVTFNELASSAVRASGTYTGNATGNRDITVPFNPVYVRIIALTNSKYSYDITLNGNNYQFGGNSDVWDANGTLGALKFTVGGAATSANESGTAYEWVALR